LTYIKTLDISSNFLTERGIKVLCKGEYFYNLKTLNLSNNKIGNIGAMTLADSPTF